MDRLTHRPKTVCPPSLNPGGKGGHKNKYINTITLNTSFHWDPLPWRYTRRSQSSPLIPKVWDKGVYWHHFYTALVWCCTGSNPWPCTSEPDADLWTIKVELKYISNPVSTFKPLTGDCWASLSKISWLYNWKLSASIMANKFSAKLALCYIIRGNDPLCSTREKNSCQTGKGVHPAFCHY